MDAVSAASAIVGLAAVVFQCAKGLRDRIKLVRYPLHPLRILRALTSILHPCLQAASEKAEVRTALSECEKDIALLESIYNNNKEFLDQQNLAADLKELKECVWSSSLFAAGSDNGAESSTTSMIC